MIAAITTYALTRNNISIRFFSKQLTLTTKNILRVFRKSSTKTAVSRNLLDWWLFRTKFQLQLQRNILEEAFFPSQSDYP